MGNCNNTIVVNQIRDDYIERMDVDGNLLCGQIMNSRQCNQQMSPNDPGDAMVASQKIIVGGEERTYCAIHALAH